MLEALHRRAARRLVRAGERRGGGGGAPPAPAAAAAPGDGLLEGFAAIHEGRTADGYALLSRGARSMATVYDAPDTTLPRLVAWLQAAGLLFDHSAWADLERTGSPPSATAGR